MTGTILDRIVATKRAEVAALQARVPLAELMARVQDVPPVRGFARALAPPAPGYPPEGGVNGGAGPVALIAEVKKASPSRGVIRADFDPVAIARAYHGAGASCLSVLTDETYFQGSLSYLHLLREIVPLPLLRKDFLVDSAQIYEARGRRRGRYPPYRRHPHARAGV